MRNTTKRLLCGLGLWGATASAFAQQQPPSNVTYGPISTAYTAIPVPLMGNVGLILLGAGLALVAWWFHRSGRFNGLASVVLLAGAGVLTLSLGVRNLHALVAVEDLVISGGKCDEQTTDSYASDANSASLTSECDDPVQVQAVSFNGQCTASMPQNACTAGMQLANGESCNLPVCEAVVNPPPPEPTACQNGADLLSTNPLGNAVVCDDPTNTVCEQDAATLCPTGWNLCSYEQHQNRKAGWTYPVGNGTVVVGEIYCRGPNVNSGAGHFTVGPYDNPTSLASDLPFNNGYGSSRPSCTSNYGCNEQTVQAMCCAPTPSCGNGVVDSPEEACDDGNLDDTDACLSTCTFRLDEEYEDEQPEAQVQ